MSDWLHAAGTLHSLHEELAIFDYTNVLRERYFIFIFFSKWKKNKANCDAKGPGYCYFLWKEIRCIVVQSFDLYDIYYADHTYIRKNKTWGDRSLNEENKYTANEDEARSEFMPPIDCSASEITACKIRVEVLRGVVHVWPRDMSISTHEYSSSATVFRESKTKCGAAVRRCSWMTFLRCFLHPRATGKTILLFTTTVKTCRRCFSSHLQYCILA